MKRRRALLLSITFVLALCAVCGAQSADCQSQQYALNRLLIDALKQMDTEQALSLVKAGADPNTQYDTQEDTVTFALGRRAPDDQTPLPPPVNHSPTALMIACGRIWDVIPGDVRQLPDCCENPALIQAMLQHGAKVNFHDSRNHTALLLAAREFRFRTMQLLLQHGAKVNVKDNGGDTPLLSALMSRPEHVISKERPNNPIWATPIINITMVRLLLQNGADPNFGDDQWDAALHHILFDAALDFKGDNKNDVGFIRVLMANETSLIRLLLAYGANPNQPDRNAETPLMLAQKIHRPDLVRLLKRRKK